MQVAYRARRLTDAHRARDVLAGAGIASHIPDEEPRTSASGASADGVILVMVDNQCLDQARRALRRGLPTIDAERDGQ